MTSLMSKIEILTSTSRLMDIKDAIKAIMALKVAYSTATNPAVSTKVGHGSPQAKFFLQPTPSKILGVDLVFRKLQEKLSTTQAKIFLHLTPKTKKKPKVLT